MFLLVKNALSSIHRMGCDLDSIKVLSYPRDEILPLREGRVTASPHRMPDGPVGAARPTTVTGAAEAAAAHLPPSRRVRGKRCSGEERNGQVFPSSPKQL